MRLFEYKISFILNFLRIAFAIFFIAQNVYAENLSRYLLNYPNLDDPDGEVVLNNQHVVLQKLIVGPGEWEGIHSHPGNQIYVHIKGGYWSGMLGGQFEYQHEFDADGSVGWMDHIPIEAKHNSGNTGDSPIELIYVTLKNEKPISKKYNKDHQLYPNVDLELLLNNHRFVVQKVILEPGQWEGAHRNRQNQIWIMIKGGIISAKKNGQFEYQKKEILPGAVGWLESNEADSWYEKGNEGDVRIEYILVTLK
jgi:mannose-6-phosphate isomerase-like protein (cupin superfamily)